MTNRSLPMTNMVSQPITSSFDGLILSRILRLAAFIIHVQQNRARTLRTPDK
jgi:hypothetical protein